MVLIKTKEARFMRKGQMVSLGNRCELEVLKNNKQSAILSTKLCENKKMLRKGKRIALVAGDDQTPAFDNSAANPTPLAPASQRISTNRTFEKKTSWSASNGFRISLIKSILQGDASLSIDRRTVDTLDGEVEHQFGIGGGYAYIPVNNIGVMGSAIYTQFTESSFSGRLEANATFGLNTMIYAFAGPNVHFWQLDDVDLIDPGFGFQVGGGLQITKNFGINAGYVMLNNYIEDGRFSADLTMQGFEVSLHGTF